ncbi:unnamed protein product [Ceutorhynchus assimilis]|uniref:Protein JTV-1 n=1 Tax=Ceutorhynchus assimilis TaxID=467358 RepID=A0A9N9MFG1_9CUCU|nr:unnamed protein product [Ceutorhynchus assimilis]
MKSPVKMYNLKPIVEQGFTVELPKCMYKLSNIHEKRSTEEHVSSPARNLDIFDQVKQFLKNCQDIPGMAELEAKQHNILEQLAELKKQISSLRQNLSIQSDENSKNTIPVMQCIKPISNANLLPDTLVVNSNPSNPPYSLELLQRLLQKQIGLTVTSYLHSSVSSLPEESSKLKDSLVNFKPLTGVPVINISLIWKNINSNAEFLITHTPISGEVNLLRFLSRSANTNLNYDAEANSFEIDSLLDQSYLLVRSKTKVERAGILQTFNQSLGKAEWLLGKKQAGIADVAVYSAIKQAAVANQLSANLAKWYQRCCVLVAA